MTKRLAVFLFVMVALAIGFMHSPATAGDVKSNVTLTSVASEQITFRLFIDDEFRCEVAKKGDSCSTYVDLGNHKISVRNPAGKVCMEPPSVLIQPGMEIMLQMRACN